MWILQKPLVYRKFQVLNTASLSEIMDSIHVVSRSPMFNCTLGCQNCSNTKPLKPLCLHLRDFHSCLLNNFYFNFYSVTILQGDYFAWCFNEPLVGLNYVAIHLSLDYNSIWLANDWHSSKIYITGLFLRAHFEITLNINMASTFHEILDSKLFICVSKSNTSC